MKIYHYDPITFEFLGEDVAYPDPLDIGKFLIPAHATTIEPPNTEENKVAIFNGKLWNVVPDYRGTTYYLTTDGRKVIIDTIGSISQLLTDKAPPDEPYVWNGNSWDIKSPVEDKAIVAINVSVEKMQTDEAVPDIIKESLSLMWKYIQEKL
jgi:hypothetical protein